MNETIGAKGIGNDYRKTLKIKKTEKKKLLDYKHQKNIKKLEKEVRKSQRLLLISAVPIIIAGKSLESIISNNDDKLTEKEIPVFSEDFNVKEESKNNNTKNISSVKLKLQEKETVTIKIENIERKYTISTEQEQVNIKKNSNKATTFDTDSKKENIKETHTQQEPKETSNEEKIVKNKIPILLLPFALISLPKEKHQDELEKYQKSQEQEQNNFDKIQSKRIIELYENRMKDLKIDLRKLIFEYNTLVDDSKKLITSDDSEQLLNKLDLIINKMEELQEKIKIEDISKYDDNYVYQLVNEYIETFDNKEFISTIKDSPMYVEISNKLDELNKEKDKLKKEVNSRLEFLSEKEDKLEEFNNKYFDFKDFNDKLLDFQDNAKFITEELDKKVKSNTTEIEESIIRVENTKKITSLLLAMLAISSLKNPGVRNSKATAVGALVGLYFLNKMQKKTAKVEKRKIIKVEDYSKEIEGKISQIDSVYELLQKTSNKIDKFIKEFEKEYQEFFGKIKECDKILSDLESVKKSIKEKEYEIEKIKKDQNEILNLNNDKVKVLKT